MNLLEWGKIEASAAGFERYQPDQCMAQNIAYPLMAPVTCLLAIPAPSWW